MKCLKCKKPIKNHNSYGLHTDCFVKWFKLSDLAEFSNLDRQKTLGASTESGRITKTTDSFYHGRYLKYSAQLNNTQYILKVMEHKYPDLPATEYLCNKIASILSLAVPEYYLIRFKDENSPSQITFVTKNFMQGKTGALHHIYKYLPKGDKHYNCETIIKVIQQQTGKLNNVERFVEICLFDSLIGNGDRHGRNLGIIDTGKNKTLAPMYDNPSFIGTEELLGAQFNISGAVWTLASKKPKTIDYIKEFKRLNLETPCLKFTKKIIHQFPVLIEEIKTSEIAEKRKQAFIKYLNSKLSDFKKAVKEDLENV